MEDLFSSQTADAKTRPPLAERLRPRTLDDFVGQEEVLGPGKVLREMIERDTLVSIILWGPPGVGKTTLARIVAARSGRSYQAFSATTSGIREVKEVMERARKLMALHGQRTLLFVDEVHRFNKAQQDAFLSFVEEGTITLIGATTENPSFEVNSALLSRCRVFELKRLAEGDLARILERALEDIDPDGGGVTVTDDARAALVQVADGDARRLLNLLEIAAGLADEGESGARAVDRDTVVQALGRRTLSYDKAGEEHFNVISALHKSLRGSDVQAGLYWLARMLEAGEDPLYVARRLVRFATEDVGLADPEAAHQALAAYRTVHYLGMPEADTALAQAVIYLALAPKSNAVYRAVRGARDAARTLGSLPVPRSIRNPVTRLMKEAGYGEGYEYPHDDPDRASAMGFLPEEVEGRTFYEPGPFGFEKDMGRRLAYWEKLRRNKREEAP